ncbi:MAG: alginate lyase family protein, partial [Candidatus Auribacterota bacterium]|nr:alginate lyase family protein [Candidatus Auribacterota bacterium]
QWLCRNLEVHLLGNHYFENGVALALAGSCFKGPDADRWYRAGKNIVTPEVREQILSDGMHFERSPMYHLRFVYTLLLLMRFGREDLRETLRGAAGSMFSALQYLIHPDGGIALFNDSAFGIYNQPADLIDLWENETGRSIEEDNTLPVGNWALPEAGYYGFRDGDGNYLICDAGPIGPDYLPGHAHGDIFSFELSLKGKRVIVDSGVYEYKEGRMRDYCRSTRAHNTVGIASQDQCEFWGAFRVARRGHPRDIVWQPSADGFVLSGRHDGYRRLAGGPTHYRKFIWRAPGSLEVRDRVESRRPVEAISRIHLHPDCLIKSHQGNRIEITYSGGRFTIIFVGSGEIIIEDSFYCPEFGRRLDNKVINFISSGTQIECGYKIGGVV